MNTRIAVFLFLVSIWIGCDDSSTKPSGNTDANSTDDTDTTTQTDTTYDCANLPQGPFEPELVFGAVASRDVTFDNEGNLIGTSYTAIYKTIFTGESTMIVQNINSCTGIEFLPDGALIYAEQMKNALYRIGDEGTAKLHDGFLKPYGLVANLQGRLYVSEPPSGKIRGLDPYTTGYTTVVEGLFGASAMAFDGEYDRLFVATKGEGDNAIYQVAIGSDGDPVGELQPFATGVGQGWHVGLGVDACGNVYVVEQHCGGDLWRSCVFRVTADGLVEEMPLLEMEESRLSGIEWGSGIDGWSENSIYLGDANQNLVYRLDIGVPSKPKVYPQQSR